MQDPSNRVLNRGGQLYCVKDAVFDELMEDLRKQCGGNWKDIARQSRLSTRYFRRLRQHTWKTASYSVMEKVLLRTGFPHWINRLTWYTPEELVQHGVWKPHSTVGLEQHAERKRQARRRAERQNGDPAAGDEGDE